MIKKFAAFLLCVCVALAVFCGCSNSKNDEIAGEWIPATASLNGETMKYSELGLEEGSFGLIFDKNGSCKITLAGITENGSYVFNDTSVDVIVNDNTQKLSYDSGTLTLTLNYSGTAATFTFIRLRDEN